MTKIKKIYKYRKKEMYVDKDLSFPNQIPFPPKHAIHAVYGILYTYIYTGGRRKAIRWEFFPAQHVVMASMDEIFVTYSYFCCVSASLSCKWWDKESALLSLNEPRLCRVETLSLFASSREHLTFSHYIIIYLYNYESNQSCSVKSMASLTI